MFKSMADVELRFHRCCSSVLRCCRNHANKNLPQIVVGTLAMRGLSVNSDTDPKEEFELACVMFRSAAEQSARAARALVCPASKN